MNVEPATRHVTGGFSTENPIVILLVDDDIVDCEHVGRCAAQTGLPLTIVEKHDPTELLRDIEAHAPCLLLLDYEFPRHNGLSLLEQVRAFDPVLPVLLLTGHDDAELAVKLMQAGAVDYIPKVALNPARLAQGIRHAIRVRAADISARAAEAALRASEQFNRSILEASDDCIKVVDFSGCLVSMSAKGQKLLGVADFTALRGTSWLDFWTGDARETAREALRAAREGSSGRFVASIVLADGQVAWFDVSVTRLPDAVPDRILIVSRDVTSQRAQAELEQQLLGIVSHDLRNPIAAVAMGVNVLKTMLPAGGPADQVVTRIERSAGRATRLLNDLLDFTQVRRANALPIKAARIDFHTTCQNIVDELAIAYAHRSILHETSGDGMGEWDPDRLGQLLGNLLVNAISYSDPETVVTVRTMERGAWVTLEVHNDGGPIPSELLPNLFQPFQRGQRHSGVTRGVGLGLFIVHQIAVAHGGVVTVESSADHGTTFTVRLPRSQSEPSDPGDVAALGACATRR